MLALLLEAVIVELGRLVERQVLVEAEIEDDARVRFAKIRRLLLLAHILGIGVPGLALLRKLGLGAERIAPLGAPVRVHVVDRHGRSPG